MTRNAQKWQFLVSVSRQCFNSNKRLKRAINAINNQYTANTLTNTPKGRIRANNNTPMNAENFQGQEGLQYQFKRGKKVVCLVDIQKC